MNDIHKGLVGVVVDTTAISMISAETHSLLYRGYAAHELAERCVFEEVAYLLWNGELPNAQQLTEFETTERSLRHLNPTVKRIIDELPLSAHPMDVLRTAVSVLGALDAETHADSQTAEPSVHTADASNAATLDESVTLFAQLPSIVAYDQRRRRGLHLVEPRDDLSYSANFLHMTFGEVPDLVVVTAFDQSMIMYAEHSFNASTFTSRVITSTESDVYSAVVGAIGALKGPLHGGANEAVMHVLDEIGTPDRAEKWVADTLARKEKIMGFGHRVYKNGDSRVPTMKAALDTLIAEYNRPDLAELYTAVEQAVYAAKGIKPNLDFPS
ncbi:MAG TPA: bifunctional 2-methylcitrate synthase/citrate synthase, partial [Glaciihabitans sp.]|nr:bifunctional 2-methylcitrate synthase/citrate synthase [Glaciihabitans sp.]